MNFAETVDQSTALEVMSMCMSIMLPATMVPLKGDTGSQPRCRLATPSEARRNKRKAIVWCEKAESQDENAGRREWGKIREDSAEEKEKDSYEQA